MPVNEACELEQKLTDLGITPQHVICNQLYPDHFPHGSPVARVVDALAADPALPSPLAEVEAHAMLSHDRHALNARYLGELRTRARAPVTELPMVFAPTLAPADVRTLGERLLARSAHRE
jgi:hypothetical protein